MKNLRLPKKLLLLVAYPVVGSWCSDFYGGPKGREFEKACADYFGVKHAVLYSILGPQV